MLRAVGWKNETELEKYVKRLKANDPSLTELDLYQNSIGDDGAKAIAEALKDKTVLTELNLYDNSIGVDLLNDINQLIDANKNHKPTVANTTQPTSSTATTTNAAHPSSPTTPTPSSNNPTDPIVEDRFLTNQQQEGTNTKGDNEHIVHENLVKLIANTQKDNERIKILIESFEDKKSNQAFSFQLTTKHQEILNILLEKTSQDSDDQEEQKAILSCKKYSEFYLELFGKLNCMIGACEGLSSGMVTGKKKGSVRSSITNLFLSNGGVELIKNTKTGALVATAIEVVKKNVPVPGAHTILSFLQMIVQLKESRDRWLGVANVADFATLASLKRNNYASYKYDVECFARIMVRALHANKAFGSIDDKFGEFKTRMLQLLAEKANTPARDKGCAVADCALAHIMKPGVDTPLYNLFDSFNFEINLHECLAANTLNMTIDEVKKLPKIQLPNTVTTMNGNNSSVLNQDIKYCVTDKTKVVSDKDALIIPGSRGVDVGFLLKELENLKVSHAEEAKRWRDSQKQHSKRLNELNKELNDSLADRAKLEHELDAVKKDLAKMKAPLQSDGGLMYADHREAYKDEVCRITQDMYELKDQTTLHCEEISALKNMIANQQEDDGTTMEKQPKRSILRRKNIK